MKKLTLCTVEGTRAELMARMEKELRVWTDHGYRGNWQMAAVQAR